jgi:ribosomal protein L21E
MVDMNKQTPDKTKPTEFEMGQIIHLKSNPSVHGAVVGIMQGKPENRYKVYIDGATKIYYTSQLQLHDKTSSELETLPLSQFHAHLTALQIRHPGLSTLYSLNAARIDFIPYRTASQT